MYNFQCRTISDKVESILEQKLSNYWNSKFKVLLTNKVNIQGNRLIQRIFSTTPVIIKNDDGYWRPNKSVELFEKRIRDNMIKKYQCLTGEKINDNILIFDRITIDNEKPIKVKYKNICLLGDKITLFPLNDELSQKIILTVLGMGIGENNSTLGAGYLNFKY